MHLEASVEAPFAATDSSTGTSLRASCPDTESSRSMKLRYCHHSEPNAARSRECVLHCQAATRIPSHGAATRACTAEHYDPRTKTARSLPRKERPGHCGQKC